MTPSFLLLAQAYVELEGRAEEFRSFREWRGYYWREDFTFVARDDQKKVYRVISREPTPWNNLRLGTTYTGLAVDWSKRPRVKVIGITGVDRTPPEFYDLKLDPSKTVTVFILRVEGRDYYVNNWFHHWSDQANAKVLANYRTDDPNYTLYGFVGGSGIPAPFDEEGRKRLEKFGAEYGGVVFHARLVEGELRVLHLMGRHKKTMSYDVFVGDASKLVPLDGRRPRFEKAEATGIEVGELKAHAVAVEDFDGDGRLDVIITGFEAPWIRYYRNLGGLKFMDATKGSGLETFVGTGSGAAVADFDRDGKLDVYLTALRGGPSRLFRGNGDGTFTDVSEKSGTLLQAPARSCAWCDVDGDGWPDLFVTCPEGSNRLFRNNRDGTFTEMKNFGAELADRHSLGCAFGDVDGDSRDDLFVANYKSQRSVLFRNLGDGRFRERPGFERRASAVGCVFGDVFNRGVLDLYVTTDSWLSGANYTEPELLKQGHAVEPCVLYINDGAGRFRAETPFELKSLAHDAVIEDFDHDGRVEIYTAVDAESGNLWATSKGGNRMWSRKAEKKEWADVGREWGVDHEANCVCAVAADFDNDGDLDLLLVNFYTNAVLLRNGTNDKNWLRVRVPSVGAQVRLFSGDRLVGFRHIQSGAGYCRSSPLEAHFGIRQGPVRVEVFFPSSKKRVIRENVQTGQRIDITER